MRESGTLDKSHSPCTAGHLAPTTRRSHDVHRWIQVQSTTTTTSTSYCERDPGSTLMAAQTNIGTTTTETYYYFDGNGSVLGLLDPSGK